MAGLLDQIDAARNGGSAPDLLSQIDAARGATPAPDAGTIGRPGRVEIPTDLGPSLGDIGNTVMAATRGASHGMSLGLDDEVGAAGGMIGTALARLIMGDPVDFSFGNGRDASSLVTGQTRPTLGSFYNDTLDQLRGQAAQDAEEHPVASTVGGIAGGLGALAPAAGAAAPATFTGRVAQGAGVGAGVGGVSGFASGQGGVENRLESAVVPAAIGAGIGAAAPAVEAGMGGLIRAIFSRDPAQTSETLAAFERQGIRPTAATVGGRTAGTSLENFGEMVPLPGNPVVRAREQQHTQLADRVNQVARAGGGTPAQDVDEFGNLIRREATGGTQRIADDVSAMETDFAGRFGSDTPVGLASTRAAIGRMMERADPETKAMLQGRLNMLDEATGTMQQRADIQDTIGRLQQLMNDPATAAVAGPEIARLQQQAAQLDRVPFKVFDNLRKRIGVATDGQSIDAQFTGPVYGGLSEDMQAAARARGLGDDWTKMKAREEQVYNSDRSPAAGGDLDLLAPASGSKGGGDLYGEFIGSEFQNGDRIGALMRNVSPRGVADIQASTIAQLGRARAGSQNAAGDQFSANEFLTNWGKMSQNAKEQIFGSDHQLMSDLDDIARIAEGMKTAGATRNTSNTERIGTTRRVVEAAMGAGAAGGIYAAPITTASTAAVGYGGLSALVSNRLAQWAAGKGPDFASRFVRSMPGLLSLPAQSEPQGDPTVNAIMKARGNGDNR